ncbi:hypothetical protein [uncultured Porphyromonas sp.]|uniref:hypothetical protein n=1 Tax=uncultured Porphyromonas sp. TaxID=159274 RepID=UPI00261D15D2|nr:hypothetical protein [uncultured Porphyromonas sp.]
MNRNISILSKTEGVSIERLHIVTWDIKSKNYYTEYGLEINRGSVSAARLELRLSLPCLPSDSKDVISLDKNLSDIENCRFIFNSDVIRITPFGSGGVSGNTVTFAGDREITILSPLGMEISEDILKIEMSNLETIGELVYVRFLVKSSQPPFQTKKNELSRRRINYDVRVNESRTASAGVKRLQKDLFSFMSVKSCFCLHIIPVEYSLGVIDSTKLKEMRELESESFEKYLGEIARKEEVVLKPSSYNIIFYKQKDRENYSFFSVFYEETLTNTQLGIAIAVNIISTSLFAFYELRTKVNPELKWDQTPLEYWIALFVIAYALGWFFWNVVKSKDLRFKRR